MSVDLEPAHRRTFVRRHAVLLVAIAALVTLGIDAGYQVYAARISHQNAAAVATTKRNAAKIARLSKAQCSQTQLLFDVFNALAADSSPRFGSPPDGPILPGARAALIGRLTVSERATAKALAPQGCRIATP